MTYRICPTERTLWLSGFLIAALALSARFGMMESTWAASACLEGAFPSGLEGGLCHLRNTLPLLFIHHRLSGIAFLCGVLACAALWKGRHVAVPILAWVAWLGGIAGAILYGTDYGVIAGLLGMSCLLLMAKRG
jgi:hypothetical protein